MADQLVSCNSDDLDRKVIRGHFLPKVEHGLGQLLALMAPQEHFGRCAEPTEPCLVPLHEEPGSVAEQLMQAVDRHVPEAVNTLS